jgi:hypothetical protein
MTSLPDGRVRDWTVAGRVERTKSVRLGASKAAVGERIDRPFARTAPFETQGKQGKREISRLRKPTLRPSVLLGASRSGVKEEASACSARNDGAPLIAHVLSVAWRLAPVEMTVRS